MSEAAAFFANKKKKKAFKFNANLIDASSITHTTHVDAPAISGYDAGESTENNRNGGNDADYDQWDDEALASTVTPVRKPAISTSTGSGLEVRDMKSLDSQRKNDDNIAEKLRVEETKAKLAAARQGMEREAAKLKEEQEKKKEKDAENKPRFGAAAASMGGGGKWLAPHLRGAGTPGSLPGAAARRPVGSGKLDVQDEELFPDLAQAEKILEQKERESQPLYMAPKKTPVGGGASWASKTTKATAVAPTSEAPKKKEEPVAPAPETEAAEQKLPESSETTAEAKKEETKAEVTASAAKPLVKKTVTKKKKKDLSTFKPSTAS